MLLQDLLLLGATAIDNDEITRKRSSTLVIPGFKEALPQDELVQWVSGQQLGTPTDVHTKMRFSRVGVPGLS